MKTEVSDEFVKTRGDAKGKPEWSRSGQPQSQAQPMAEQKISNWRDRASAPTTNPQPAAESWRQNSSRQQGGSSSVAPAQAPRTAAPAATVTPQDQTLALMSLLGLKKEREATQSLESTQQQPQPRPPPLQQAPTPGQMPVSPFSRDLPCLLVHVHPFQNLPKPPLFWQQEAQKQQQSDRIKSQQWYRSAQAGADLGQPPPIAGAQMRQPLLQQHASVPHSGFNNGNQQRSNHNMAAQSVFNNNHVRMQQTNPYQTYQPHHTPDLPPFQQLKDIHNVVSPRYSSIQDFVPIQAYRPRKSKRTQPIGGRQEPDAVIIN